MTVGGEARFSIRYDRWCGWLLGLLGGGRRWSRVDVDASVVRVQMGPHFRGTIPRASIRATHRWIGLVGGWGVHGWRGRWLVNGSSKGIVVLDIEPRTPARVLGVPVRLRQLAVSLDDPEGFSRALGLPLDEPG